ncbi:hypothetical protein [Methanococcoides sp. AM1]
MLQYTSGSSSCSYWHTVYTSQFP